MKITLDIINSGKSLGTLGWLIEKAARIEVNDTQKGRVARLLDTNGHRLQTLAVAYDGYTETLSKSLASSHVGIGADIPWTDAAWVVLERLAETAEGLLHEPVELADGVVVEVKLTGETTGTAKPNV